VIVATVRALKMHGGVAKAELGREDVAAVERGVANLARHVENIHKFGLPVVVALNRFDTDTPAEIKAIQAAMARLDTQAILCTHWSDGAAGAEELARSVKARIEAGAARFQPIYPDAMPLAEKLRTIAREVYRARDVAIPHPRCSAWRGGRRRASATCRSASPRPSIPSAPTRPRSARRWTMCCRCGRCGSRPAPASWWRSAGRS
jgi:formyltetrahydrofolate synthetase